MLINLGCGDRYAGGWLNVDHAGSPHKKDLTLDITDELPWAPGSVLHVYLGHVLEHLTMAQCRSLLKRLRPLVRPEGQILVVGPDVEVAQAMADAGTLEVTMDSLRFGGNRWPGDEHRWECTAGKVARILRAAGWGSVEDVGINNVAGFWPVADRNPQWQCAVTARNDK